VPALCGSKWDELTAIGGQRSAFGYDALAKKNTSGAASRLAADSTSAVDALFDQRRLACLMVLDDAASHSRETHRRPKISSFL